MGKVAFSQNVAEYTLVHFIEDDLFEIGRSIFFNPRDSAWQTFFGHWVQRHLEYYVDVFEWIYTHIVYMAIFDIDTHLSRVDKLLDKTAAPVYIVSVAAIYFIYITTFLGLSWISITYVRYLDIFVQAFIGIFLVLRFLPYRNHELRKNDAMLIFGSGIFLLTNLGLSTYITKFMNTTVKSVENNVLKVKHPY